MKDLFAWEQSVADAAFAKIKDGTPCTLAEYADLAKEYRRLLKQVRIVTRISDKTTVDLNTCKLDLQEKVLFDKLTGLYNRRFFDDAMTRLLHTLSACGGLLSVLMVDVDFFKQYNDTYGHEQGDECLQAVAQALACGIRRDEDFAARYGGEEFVVVLPQTDNNGACAMANRILENIRQRNIPHEKSTVESCVTVSVGITTGSVQLFHTSEDFVRAADAALYRSKRSGRNKCTFIKLEEEL